MTTTIHDVMFPEIHDAIDEIDEFELPPGVEVFGSAVTSEVGKPLKVSVALRFENGRFAGWGRGKIINLGRFTGSILSTDETAERLGISPRSVRRLVESGELIGYCFPNKILIFEEEVKEYINIERAKKGGNHE